MFSATRSINRLSIMQIFIWRTLREKVTVKLTERRTRNEAYRQVQGVQRGDETSTEKRFLGRIGGDFCLVVPHTRRVCKERPRRPHNVCISLSIGAPGTILVHPVLRKLQRPPAVRFHISLCVVSASTY